jgi:hypothetical protein
VNLSKNCDRVRLHEKEATASDAVADLLLQRRQKENFKALITQKQSYKCVACHAASRDM